jgi:hypothetical protein
MDDERAHLVQADRHIAETRAHIVRQRMRLGWAIQLGHDLEIATDMLRALEGSLRAFEAHRRLILDRLEAEE